MNEIKIDLDAKCKRCHKGGATQNGLCMTCIAKAMKNGEFDHLLDKCRKRVSKKLSQMKLEL